MPELSQTLLAVEDAETFRALVAALRDDLAGDLSDPDAPGHRSCADALEAMLDWPQSREGRSALDGVSSWLAAAKLLIAGAFHD